MNKRTLSIKSINKILELIDTEKKLLYSKEHIEYLYLRYKENEYLDDKTIKTLN